VNSDVAVKQNDTELVFTQVLDAPRELVYQAFSDEKRVQHWWMPAPGWTTPVCTIDFKVGGEWRYCFRSPEGQESWAKSIYQKITPPKEVVFIDNLTDADGNFLENFPAKLTTITFTDLGDKTRIEIQVKLATAEDTEQLVKMGFISGFTATLNQLAQYVTNSSTSKERG